jgi:hypothetical protein
MLNKPMENVMADRDDATDRLIEVFTQAVQLLRINHGLDSEVQLEMPAMDLLMDYSLTLGPAGLAAVLSNLAEEGGLVTEPQAAAVLSRFLKVKFRTN